MNRCHVCHEARQYKETESKTEHGKTAVVARVRCPCGEVGPDASPRDGEKIESVWVRAEQRWNLRNPV